MKHCAQCGGRMLVRDSRYAINDYGTESIWRVRECEVCKDTMTTYEVTAAHFNEARANAKMVSMFSEIFEFKNKGKLGQIWLNTKSSRRAVKGERNGRNNI